MLKHSPETATAALVSLINYPFESCTFPERWKMAAVTCIPKLKWPSSNFKDYRFISLLSCIGKIAEAVILERLQKLGKGTVVYKSFSLDSEGVTLIRRSFCVSPNTSQMGLITISQHVHYFRCQKKLSRGYGMLVF
jgi:hypothetical protein